VSYPLRELSCLPAGIAPESGAEWRLAGLAESGRLRVHLQQTLPLAGAAKAHELAESGRTAGKIALTL
jgi:NADPH:quinone reductase-like Zn-dependent oxidoreductase